MIPVQNVELNQQLSGAGCVGPLIAEHVLDLSMASANDVQENNHTEL